MICLAGSLPGQLGEREGGAREIDGPRGFLLPDSPPGLDTETRVTTEIIGATHGGVRRQARSRYLASWTVAADLESLLDFAGATLFLDVRSTRGDSTSEDVGDLQGVSSLEAGEADRVSELWYQQVLWDKRLRGRVGVLDANSEFAAVEAAAGFLNSAAGTSPTLLGVPTWPGTAPGLELFARPADRLSVGLGVYDGGSAGALTLAPADRSAGAADDPAALGPFAIGEVELRTSGRSGGGRLAVGAWHSGARLQRFDGATENGTEGWYALAEQRVWRERRGRRDDSQGLWLFGLYGCADARVAEASQHVLAGATYRGAIPRRDEDELGAMVSHVDLSDAPAAEFGGNETAFELFYRAQVSGASALTASLQYVREPSGDPDTSDAVVLGVRYEMVF